MKAGTAWATITMTLALVTVAIVMARMDTYQQDVNYQEVVRKAKSRATAAGENTACFWQLKDGNVVVEVYNVPCKAWPGQPAWAKTPNLVITWPDSHGTGEGEGGNYSMQ